MSVQFQQITASPNHTVEEVIKVIDRGGCQLALIVDEMQKLLGIVTDGDIRRAILKGCRISETAKSIMNSEPHVISPFVGKLQALSLMQGLGINVFPIVDENRIVVGVLRKEECLLPKMRQESVVIMAGGMGARLKQLTRDTPKPMLKVGSRPILEMIIRNFVSQGFQDFYLAVNYKAEQIEDYFQDGTELGVKITYLKEKKRLGTAGALSLLPDIADLPILVTNADLLMSYDFTLMLDAHYYSEASATVGVRRHSTQIPFGVVNESDGIISTIKEKPTLDFYVCSGVNVLSAELINMVPPDCFFDMPSLVNDAVKAGLKIVSHEIDGYWLDIGRPDDYEKANWDYEKGLT